MVSNLEPMPRHFPYERTTPVMLRVRRLLAAGLIAALISPTVPAFAATLIVSNPAAVPTIGPTRTSLGANPMPLTPLGKPGPIPSASAGGNTVAWPHPGSQPIELVQDRTATSQTFLNPNGTFTTVVSPQARFYQSPNTHVWHALNTKLTADAAGTGFHTPSTPFGLRIAQTLVCSQIEMDSFITEIPHFQRLKFPTFII